MNKKHFSHQTSSCQEIFMYPVARTTQFTLELLKSGSINLEIWTNISQWRSKNHPKCFDRSPLIQRTLASSCLVFFFKLANGRHSTSSSWRKQHKSMRSSGDFVTWFTPLWTSAPMLLNWRRTPKAFGWRLTHQQTWTRFGGKYVKHGKNTNLRPHDYKKKVVHLYTKAKVDCTGWSSNLFNNWKVNVGRKR